MEKMRQARIHSSLLARLRASSLATASLAISLLICVQPLTGYTSVQPSSSRLQVQSAIPDATQPCSDDVAKWWQELRAAAQEAVTANRRKDEALREALSKRRTGIASDDQDEVLPRKQRDTLNEMIEAATRKYLGVLKDGRDKAYTPPILPRRFLVLYTARPNYTELARRKKTGGDVRLRVELRSDGTVGDVSIVSGLGDGLDENAIKAVRRTVFLPQVGKGGFQTVFSPMEVSFNIR
jgi:TonB family protein